MSLFEKKEQLTRSELRQALREASPFIPGSGARMFSRRERVEMEKEVFGRRYGAYITKEDYRKALGKLRVKRSRVKTGKERLGIDRRIRFLRKMGGI